MISAHLLLCLAYTQEPVDTPSVRYFQENFIVRVGDKRAVVPLQLPKERPVLSVSFRKDKNYAVWDERGLTIRIGKVAKSTRLDVISTSPKAFEREEILDNVAKFKAKERFPWATALSGARRVGNLAFFLARWEDKNKKPWMEALVSVDLTESTFHPKFLARLDGLSLADKPIDDRLSILNNQMTAIVRKGEQWGLAAFEPETSKFEFKPIGRRLESYMPLTTNTGAYVERTDYGAKIGGRADLISLAKRELVEARGNLRFADKHSPLVAVITRENETRLINTETGAELELLSSTSMRRTPLGLVVWSPYNAPRRAWLYEMNRWTVLAEWVGRG